MVRGRPSITLSGEKKKLKYTGRICIVSVGLIIIYVVNMPFRSRKSGLIRLTINK